MEFASKMAFNSSPTKKITKKKKNSESLDLDQVVPQKQKKSAPKKKLVLNLDECIGTIQESIESVFKYTTNENFRQKTMKILKVDSPCLVSEAVSFHLNQLTKSIYDEKKVVDVRSEAEETHFQADNDHLVPRLTTLDEDDDYFEQLAFNDEL